MESGVSNPVENNSTLVALGGGIRMRQQQQDPAKQASREALLHKARQLYQQEQAKSRDYLTGAPAGRSSSSQGASTSSSADVRGGPGKVTIRPARPMQACPFSSAQLQQSQAAPAAVAGLEAAIEKAPRYGLNARALLLLSVGQVALQEGALRIPGTGKPRSQTPGQGACGGLGLRVRVWARGHVGV